ncbi:hypothetical protein INR49_008431 [Caranx melampygus]|nr:hypothetical protein INR49_008431 [Caranx melampygus]
MSDQKPNVQEDKDVESVSDSPGLTQEPLQSHTFCLKNNTAGLSSDEHENPLNGTQPNPFVYSSVPAVPHAGNSLPSGALVNGPGSHPTSEVHCVLNKGSVLSNNVLDAAWQVEKDTSPEVLPPPSELQSDAWKNTAGLAVKTLATQPGVNTPLSHSEENESKLACSALSGDDAEQMHISRPRTEETIETGSVRSVEWSESSSDDCDDVEVIRWDSARRRFLRNDRRLETRVIHQRDRRHNTHGGRNDLESRSLHTKANQNSPSMRNMSTPLQNTIDNMNGNILPRLSQRRKKHFGVVELEKGCEGGHNFSDDISRATGGFLESSESERNPYARKYFRKRQRFSTRDQSPCKLTDEDDGDEDCSDIEQLIIKEEYIETTVCDKSLESPCTSTSESFVISPSQVVEHKPCPYCPAMFESGVGLSNHVRGHLHRVGLSYNARHMVSAEQVALRDHQPRTRRRIPGGSRKMKRAVKPDTQGEHTCPLCWGWFDTKTGLSNHVRGHLKRIGRSVTSTSKSPLCILNELLQDKKEHGNILQLLNQDHLPTGPSVSQRFISSSGLVLTHTALPAKHQYEMKSPQAMGGKQETQALSERNKPQAEAQTSVKNSSSTLVELLKTRRESIELATRNNQDAHTARKLCGMTKDYNKEIPRVEPDWTHGEFDSSKICIECNSDFPAAVSLSGHLQAYACRKRIATFEKPGYDYKQKKPRPRPGLKKKILPSLNAQIYTLTCRFCDLVFQGPLSIQEDWIKHLQRHLLHTNVPHSGTGMVEVLGLRHKIQISMSDGHPDTV